MQILLLAPGSLARALLAPRDLEQRIAPHRQSMAALPILSMLMTLEVRLEPARRKKLLPLRAPVSARS
jgi:hypothetical protein